MAMAYTKRKKKKGKRVVRRLASRGVRRAPIKRTIRR